MFKLNEMHLKSYSISTAVEQADGTGIVLLSYKPIFVIESKKTFF